MAGNVRDGGGSGSGLRQGGSEDQGSQGAS
ncbi:unnamed protein product [Linum tenue]|uniref:Uncharacterized protein n=1 Tax=Linum tenue TaxID=586396 RepID=A0AAV0RJN4_9ROSI|nr:unnamed protein product [Linum tenue]